MSSETKKFDHISVTCVADDHHGKRFSVRTSQTGVFIGGIFKHVDQYKFNPGDLPLRSAVLLEIVAMLDEWNGVTE